MKVQGVLTIATYFYVLGIVAEKLHGVREIKWYLRLARANKDEHFERMGSEKLQIPGLDVLEVNQYVVRGQGNLQIYMRPRLFYSL